MRVGRRKIIAVAVVVLTIAAAIAAWNIGGTDLLLAVVLGTVLLGLGAVASMVVQSERRLRVIAKGPSAKIAALSKNVDALNRSVVALGKQVQRPSEHAEALLRAVKAGHTRLELEQERRLSDQTSALEAALEQQRVEFVERLNKAIQRLLRQFKHSPAEIDALLQVHRRLQLDDPLPLMGGWALSPRSLLQAIELTNRPEVSLVVECGSGTSTLFMARALEMQGGTERRLVALEHLTEFAEKTEKAVKDHGLTHLVDVRYAPLERVQIGGDTYSWYATSAISDLVNIDLLLVDGPPRSTGPMARFPAYPLLRDKLSPSAVIIVDDVQRSDEREMVNRWIQLGKLKEERALSAEQLILRVDSNTEDSGPDASVEKDPSQDEQGEP